MMHLGLHSAQMRILIHTLSTGYRMRVRVASLTLDGDWDADLTDRLLDGQVTVDGTADVTRTASVTLLDPKRTLDFDSDSPSETALYLDRMIRIWYGVRVDYGDGPEWEDIPIFTGPISSLSRTGPEVSVEAQGKESLAMGAVWKPLTLQKGRTKATAIRIILRERAGENLFHIHQLRPTLPKKLSLHRQDVPWTRAKSLARSMDRQLFYNGRGICVLRRLPGKPIVEFTEQTLLSPLDASYTFEDTVNAVFVRGGIPASGKIQIASEVFPPHRHRLSPWRLGRVNAHGQLVPRYLMATVEDNHIRSYVEARRAARARLRQGLMQGVDASCDVLPVPMLEAGDMVRVTTSEGAVTFRVQTFSLALTPGQPMTIGYTRNLRTGRLGRAGSLRLRRRTPEHAAEWAAYKHKQWAKAHPELAKKQAAKQNKDAAQPRTHHAHRGRTRHRART